MINQLYKAFGEERTIKEWSKQSICKVSHLTLISRFFKLKWDLEKSLISPLKNKRAEQFVGNYINGYKILKIISRSKHGDVKVETICSCGNKYITFLNLIKNNKTCCRLCKNKKIGKANTKHGLKNTFLANMWYSTNDRCYNSKVANYFNYGGRNIKMYDKWKRKKYGGVSDIESSKNFVNHAKEVAIKQNISWNDIENKKSPKGKRYYTFDRIDNNKGYEPGNMRWATPIEQCLNQRKRIKNFDYDKKIKELQEEILFLKLELSKYKTLDA